MKLDHLILGAILVLILMQRGCPAQASTDDLPRIARSLETIARCSCK